MPFYSYFIIFPTIFTISSIIFRVGLFYTSNIILLSLVPFFLIDTFFIILNYSLNIIFFNL